LRRVRLPAGIDPHVHLRDPGATHKETFLTGTSAALAGGYACVLDMPNNWTPIANAQTLAAKQDAARCAVCDYGLWFGATSNNMAEFDRVAAKCVGLKVYMTHTYGSLLVEDPTALLNVFKGWPANRPIAVHAEGSATLVAMVLGHLFGKRVHICHVSQAWQLAAIRAAKEKGFDVTCEVTPHHLFLTEEDARRLGSLGEMRPPLGSPEDQRALWENLDVIDVLATDHAPHTLDEKAGPNPPSGVPGLETALPLMLTAVNQGRLTLDKLVDMIHTAPARIFDIAPPLDTFAIAETGTDAEIKGNELQTLCKWSPFEGMKVTARIAETWIRGTLAWSNRRVQVAPGFGQPILGASNS
jgi:dihydroorotase-like cyclic amidohydrolase